MSKALLIDGNSLMFRAYYATSYTGNLMKTSTGLYTNAVFGFINMVSKLLESKPDYVFVAFDKGKQTFRHQAFDDYKGGRKPMPEEFRVQIPYIKEYLDVINVKREERIDFEADDLVASVSKLAEDNNVDEIVVVSGDKDLLQLVRNNVKVCLTKKGISELEEYTKDNFFDKMGFNANQIPDYKGLVGDSSDNLPGIKGIGEKTAVKFLAEYGTLENLVNNVDNLKGKTKELIEQEKETGLTCKKLATLVYDIDLGFGLDDIKYKEPNKDNLREFYNALEFKSFITRLDASGKTNIDDNQNDSLGEKSSQLLEINANYSVVDRNFDYSKYLDKKVVVIPEIFGENYYNGEFLGLGVACEDEYTFINASECLVSLTLKKLLETSANIITFDYKKLYVILRKRGIKANVPFFDLLLAIYLLDSRRGNEDFKACLGEDNEYKLSSNEDIYGKGAKASIPDVDIYAKYSIDKCFVLDKVYNSFLEKINNEELNDLFKCELELSKVLGDMEINGLIVSKDSLKKCEEELSIKQKEYEKEIYEEAGCEFNINSPKQLGEVLFVNMGLPSGKKNKNGYSTDVSTLEHLASMNVKIAKLVLDYRKVTKIISTYVNGLYSVMDENSYIHPLYKQALTVTGRLSSVEPNIQNMPIRDDVGKVIRQAFISRFIPFDGKIVSLDYSQIELRVLSCMANDEKMIEAFNSDVDFHRATAAWIFDKDPSMITDHERSSAKAINFGIVYGMSAWGLSETIGISPKEAKSYIDKYFSNYPGIDTFIKETINQAKIDGYTKTMFNRKRFIPELKSMNKTIYQFGERTAVNSPIQGTAADIIKFAMVKVGKFLEDNNYKSKLIAQVHDELVFDCIPEEIDSLIKGVKEIMESVVNLKVKLIAKSAIGDNWMEA